ncbi:MAG: hypothetical protein M1819_000932 [Sarea resinae]|nr:MAG: hypothetical protein M1819_000932 [Sarea resinae]
MFGTSARFLSDLKSSGLKPRELIDLSSLRTVTSTGSTLTADVCNWFYDHGFPSDIHLISMSGGTDMACSLVTGSPTLPVYSGEIQCDSLGMAVDIVDNTSSTVVSIKETGEPGELVCLQPFPSQPVMFWGENGMKRYQSSYFERFGNRVWCQGDFVMVVPDTKGILMLGRSDGVLNPSGVRFGSAEIYAIVEKIPDIDDSICVGQRRPQDNDEAVVLFVKMKPSSRLTRQLREEIKKAIREARSPRHVPKYIFEITEIPYTVNGKKIELAVKQIVSGQPLKPNGAVANPASFASYQRFFDIEKADQADLAAKL